MKVVIVGLGNQGIKRKKFLNKNEFIYSVDPYNKNADFKSIKSVPLSLYDTIFICTPENEKINLIKFCLKNNKNFLIEKPFPILSKNQFNKLSNSIIKSKVVFYVAYNHRFEPFIIKLKKFLKNKILGNIYSFKLFYGNGTAKLIKNSPWRDKGHGVIDDLFPHMLDLIYYFNKNMSLNINLSKKKNYYFFFNKFENKTPDNAILNIHNKKFFFSLQASYCSWKNKFYIEITGEKGSIHLNSLSKWGEVLLKLRKRIFPSGYPKEKIFYMKRKDTSWKKEHLFFKKLIMDKKKNNLSKEFWINQNLYKLKKIAN